MISIFHFISPKNYIVLCSEKSSNEILAETHLDDNNAFIKVLRE